MDSTKISAKARIVVTDNHHLSHQILIQNIPKTHFKSDGLNYNLKLKRSSEKGSLTLLLIISKELFLKKTNIKCGWCQITIRKDLIDINIERDISHKSIKLIEGQYQLEYNQNFPIKLDISHSITKVVFEEKYYPRIKRMLENRKKTSKPTQDKNKLKEVKKKTTTDKPNQIVQSDKTTNPTKSDNGKTLRTARETSFRRCEHCDYFIQRQKRCGLFSRLVQPDNICSRFNYTRYKTYLGGGFSPR
jgi:hypothetical protein